MRPALLIRLRPNGPWRSGAGDGAGDPTRQDTLYRSDRLFSSVTLAMRELGYLDEWLNDTAHNAKPAVAFTSLFPFQGDTLFAPPPIAVWPPAPSAVTSSSPVFLSKLRWEAARFVPLSLLESLLAGEAILAEQWFPDPDSGCLLRRDRPSLSPYRPVLRKTAAVDRATGRNGRVDAYACVEFEPGAGLWTVARFSDEAAGEKWEDRVRAAFRLAADTGFGGRRKSGWGHAAAPEFQSGEWPAIVLTKPWPSPNGSSPAALEKTRYWLLSLYSPATDDSIDWASGSYELTVRAGRVESAAGAGDQKKNVQMIAEGSVLEAHAEPTGAAVDVAPNGFAHPVYRAGFAVWIALPEPAISEPRSQPTVTTELPQENPDAV